MNPSPSQNMIDASHAKLKKHIDELNQVLYALQLIRNQKSDKRLSILHTSVGQLSAYLVKGVHMGEEINRDLEALVGAQEKELKKIRQ